MTRIALRCPGRRRSRRLETLGEGGALAILTFPLRYYAYLTAPAWRPVAAAPLAAAAEGDAAGGADFEPPTAATGPLAA